MGTLEKFKTFGDVFDAFTIRNLFELASKGAFDEETLSPVSIGKEANVFSAAAADRKVIVKIFRLETADFNRMYDYIRTDPRYAHLKHKRREIIFAWAQREYRNLLKARDAVVAAPLPMHIMKNILVMSFIGNGGIAPKIKDAVPEQPQKFFDAVVANMRKFYRSGFVHGDLSGFNILNDREKPVLIDFSQAVPLRDPKADELLQRDCKNVAKFFAKHGVKATEEKILAAVKEK